jgi:hypothetical protein
MELFYATRVKVRQELGVSAEAVFDVIAHHYSGTGVELSHRQVANEANVSAKTVRRIIDKLVDAGWLKRDHQFRDNRQRANWYEIPTFAHGDPGDQGGHSDHPNTDTSKEEVEDVDLHQGDVLLLQDPEVEVLLPRDNVAEGASEGLRPSAMAGSATTQEDLGPIPGKYHSADGPVPVEDSGERGTGVSSEGLRPSGVAVTSHQTNSAGDDNPERVWPSKDSPMPVSKPRTPFGRNVFDLCSESRWLVIHFEGFVLEKSNQERLAKGWKLEETVGEVRREKWLRNALELLDVHSLSEVCSVIDWVFTDHSGYLPFVVHTEYSHRPRTEDRKDTNLKKILDNYEQLQAEMAGDDRHRHADLVVNDRPRVNYGHPFEDPDQEAKITELVDDFSQYRLSMGDKEIHHTHRGRWAKTFRIMLAYKGYAFEDIKRVVTSLKDFEYYMDLSRYNDAFDLSSREGEFDHVLELVNGLTEVKCARVEHKKRGVAGDVSASASKGCAAAFSPWGDDEDLYDVRLGKERGFSISSSWWAGEDDNADEPPNFASADDHDAWERYLSPNADEEE